MGTLAVLAAQPSELVPKRCGPPYDPGQPPPRKGPPPCQPPLNPGDFNVGFAAGTSGVGGGVCCVEVAPAPPLIGATACAVESPNDKVSTAAATATPAPTRTATLECLVLTSRLMFAAPSPDCDSHARTIKPPNIQLLVLGTTRAGARLGRSLLNSFYLSPRHTVAVTTASLRSASAGGRHLPCLTRLLVLQRLVVHTFGELIDDRLAERRQIFR